MNKEEIINELKYWLNFEAIQINKIEVINILNLIKDLEQQNLKYKEVIDKAINSIDILQEIIYQQPTNNSADDLWLLDKLDGIKNILKEVE